VELELKNQLLRVPKKSIQTLHVGLLRVMLSVLRIIWVAIILMTANQRGVAKMVDRNHFVQPNDIIEIRFNV
jgi:hypothetical protein